ncbi:hypothetical protein [Pseudomonas sp. WS 5414]|uniref:hypothetical protein n=1 Tax=Pseudomonas sp. WS 5414 TaxID=2717478 RepID=UPI0014728D8C|nr:hypothetical protein [Pseudomonas sp. WS 5414]NMY67328.1 hypothetical protein [Pseudomonas sp. WS 5414]
MTTLVTRKQDFLVSGVELQINQGSSCYAAIDSASTILASVNALLGALVGEGPDNGNEIYGVRVLTQHCEALLDAVAVVVREAENLAPQNASSEIVARDSEVQR